MELYRKQSGKPEQISVGTADLSAVIWTLDLPIVKTQYQPLEQEAKLLRETVLLNITKLITKLKFTKTALRLRQEKLQCYYGKESYSIGWNGKRRGEINFAKRWHILNLKKEIKLPHNVGDLLKTCTQGIKRWRQVSIL